MSAHRNGDIEAHLPAPTATQEKDLLSQQPSEKATTRAPRGTTLSETMPAPIRLLLTLLVCFLVSFSVAAAWLPDAPSPEQHAEAAEASDSTISHILKAVSPGSLHDALHRFLPRYQHGVYESDTAALEAVHREHAALAAAVVQHLARRDNTTSSSTSQSPPPTSSSTSIPTSSTVSPPTSSSTSIPTSTSSRTSSATSSDTTPPTTSSDTSSSRSRRPVTSTFTSNVNGVPVVVTSTQYVDGDMHESATQTKPAGSLHTDAAAGVRRDLGFVFAGAVGAVGMLLV